MSLPWRGEDRQNSLPPALEGAVGELQALLEPNPAQLAASYQRVRQTLAGLPAALPAARQNPGASRWRRVAADCRRAAWAISGGAALALLAGFALGRLSSGAAALDAVPSGVASVSADPAPAAATMPLPSPTPTGLELQPARELPVAE